MYKTLFEKLLLNSLSFIQEIKISFFVISFKINKLNWFPPDFGLKAVRNSAHDGLLDAQGSGWPRTLNSEQLYEVHN